LVSLGCILFTSLGSVCSGDHVVESVYDQVGEGNYTYYSLGMQGRIALILTSTQGDADLYVSSEIDHPTFYLEEHSLSSTTCGDDRIDISEFMDRPIHIAVYGHPRAAISSFKLDVIRVDVEKEIDYFKERSDGKGEPEGGDNAAAEDGEGSDDANTETLFQIIWPILKSILEILIDVVL